MKCYILIDKDGIPLFLSENQEIIEKNLKNYVGAPQECEFGGFFEVEDNEFDDPVLGYYVITYPIGYKNTLRYAYTDKFYLYQLNLSN